MAETRLILASQSLARQKMLENAGLRFSIVPAGIDEAAIIERLQKNRINAPGIALELSVAKALKVAQENRDALVIGSDQLLVFRKRIMGKAATKEEARKGLMRLRGKTHILLSAVTVVKGNEILWQTLDEAKLTMHDFDDAFLEQYCGNAGDALTRSVGGYELENYGSWLFSEVKGDFFTILGMPLLPLLSYLKDNHGFSP